MNSPKLKLDNGDRSNEKRLCTALILAGLFAVGTAQANPYASWQSAVSDDDIVKVQDSFNRSQDNDVSVAIEKTRTEDNDYTSSYYKSEDNDITKSYQKSEDNDVSSWYRHSEDNDVTEDNDISSWYKSSEDNDITKTHTEDNDYTHTEDNDVTTDIDVDFRIATPTLTSTKYQSQDAGHEADATVLGAARGHDTSVRGGPTVVSAGNDEQVFYGPAMVNNNTNQLPQNNLFVQGSNMAPISQSNTFAGRDMGPKGVFAPVGNTSATVWGNVDQTSAAQIGQSGDSSNSIADTMSAPISQ